MNMPAGDWGARFRWSFEDLACQETLQKHSATMSDLDIVYDNDGLWDWGDPRGDGPEALRKMVDQYADAGARGIIWGCGNNLAWSYTPKVQEAWCDHVPPGDPDIGRTAARLRSWFDAGSDPLAVVLERAKVRNLPVLAGFRLNRFMPRFGTESWFEKNPHVVLSEASCPLYPNQFSANLALPEVREHFVAGSVDVVERYGVDGLHLEFMRAVPFFEGNEPDKIEHMNTFLRMLRDELDRIGERRGRRVRLAIWSGTPGNYRVIRKGLFPPEFFDLAFHGIEPRTWMAEKWVDLLMLSVWSGGGGRRTPVDLAPWMERARGSETQVLGTVDNAADPPEPERMAESEQVIRQTHAASDGVFLFNTQPFHLALLLKHGRRKEQR